MFPFTSLYQQEKNSNKFLLLICFFCNIIIVNSSLCISEEKQNLALISIQEPASLIQIYSQATNLQQCLDQCCTLTLDHTGEPKKECNAVSFYESGTKYMCVLLNCRPFDKCSWKSTAQNFVAGYLRVNKTAVAATTTATIATTTTATIATTTSATTTIATTIITTTVATTIIPTTIFNPQIQITYTVVAEDPLPIWNIVDDVGTTTTASTTLTKLDVPQFSTEPINNGQITTPTNSIRKETNRANYQPANQVKPGHPTFWIMKNIYALIGVVCLISLLAIVAAVVVKKYQGKSQRKPQYKQLRDYDIRVEPPASGAALLSA